MSEAPRIFGRYHLLELIARGGMAEVYKAKSHGVEGFEKILVIKSILPELGHDASFVEMFVQEAKIAVSLSHPNIVQVFDLGCAEDRYFIAMEYVAGTDLSTMLRRAARHELPLRPALSAFIASEIAQALDYAHRRRDASLRPMSLVHRDVSPQNILLGFEGEVKLTDFGIAKALHAVAEDTQAGVLKGKYAYMAPEQARGEPVDARTDLYALGIVLYECLTGTHPFLSSSSYETLRNVRDGVVIPIEARAPSIPPTLARIVARSLAPRPEDRYATAGALQADLLEFMYAHGHRAGPTDLATYLDALIAAADASPPPDLLEPGADLRKTFEIEPTKVSLQRRSDSVPRLDPELPGPDASGARPPERGSTRVLVAPQPEQRDVAAIVLGGDPRLPLTEAVLETLRKAGGMRVADAGAPGWHLALFGATSPDGREAESAARCLLHLGMAASTRTGSAGPPRPMGMHVGRVLVDIDGSVARDARLDELVEGATRAAARSRPGQIAVTPPAGAHLRRLFNLRPLGDTGFLLLLDERNFTEANGRFVGRRGALRQIGEALAAAANGEIRVLRIVGEAGAGKTRILLETLRRIRQGGHHASMMIAQVDRHGPRVPLGTCNQMLREILGVDDFDLASDVRRKVARLRELGLRPADQAAIAQVLGAPIPGSEVDPGNPRLAPAVARLVAKLAEDRLTVFAFDGIECADPESMALVDAILSHGRDAKIALLLTHRPGVQLPGEGNRPVESVYLGPLDADDVARLTASRLGADEVPEDLLREVSLKSGGNPLYVEEYLRALEDAGAIAHHGRVVEYRASAVDVEIPKTLRGMVAQRLQRFGAPERHLLQVAAVAGGRVGSAVLGRVCGRSHTEVETSLEELRRGGVLARHGADEHEFVHAIVAEVLRNGLPIQARRALHGALADALEDLHPERLDDLAERIAHHLREAGDRQRAVPYLERAAERRATEGMTSSAVAHLVTAVEALSLDPAPHLDRIFRLYARVGELSYRAREVETGTRHMAAALELAESCDRPREVARCAMNIGRLLAQGSRFDEAGHWLTMARETARSLGDAALLRDVSLATAEATTHGGDVGSAVGLLREALSISSELGQSEAEVRCLLLLALAYAGMAQATEAQRAVEQAAMRMGADADPYARCELLTTEALVDYYVGERERAVIKGQHARDLAKEYGFTYHAALNAHYLGENLLRLGDYTRSFAMLSRSFQEARDGGFLRLQHNSMRVLGFLDRAKFGSEEGRARMVAACQFAQHHGYVGDLVAGRYMLAYLDATEGQHQAALAGFQSTRELAAELAQRQYELAATEAIAALAEGAPVRLIR